MRKILQYVFCFLIFSIVWIVLNEKISVINIFIGGILGLICIYITNKFLMSSDYITTYSFNIKAMLIYPFYLIYKIYYSGIITIGKIITGRIKPSFIDLETKLDKDLYINIIANSITLTPGTVTIFRKGRKIRVLTVVNSDNKKIIPGFEKIFKGR